jgi:succinoglycan biosynthesis protein ExoM
MQGTVDISKGRNPKANVAEKSCSICIATYRRPYLLRQLLESLLRQQLDDGIRVEIIVVDNDAEQSAKELVESFQDARFPIIYAVESRKKISLARNKGVELAHGDYLLFIDDDETASERWLSTMLETLHKHNADAVIGRVISDFHSDTPEWIKSVYLFNRPVVSTGSRPGYLSTANCLVKVSVFKSEQALFDERFGITGGEDSHLFHRLLQKGKHFVYSGEAKVNEFIPPERTKTKWMLKRAYRTGNIYGRITIELAENKALERVKTFVSGLIRLIASLVLMLIHLPFINKRWHWLLKAAANCGRMLSAFNVKISGY